MSPCGDEIILNHDAQNMILKLRLQFLPVKKHQHACALYKPIWFPRTEINGLVPQSQCLMICGQKITVVWFH